MSKAKFAAVKELITEKRYTEARALLRSIDHPTAREWEVKLDKLDPTPIPAALPNRTRGTRLWRNIWGVLALVSLGWLCYGLYVSTMAYGEVAGPEASEATQAGAAIGSSLGIAGFLCSGLPFLLLFLYAYARAGAAIRGERQHREVLEAMTRR